ncbi:hypothetical protein DPMN_150530 [Dreissena polymorpha]|uniref:Uncharacterized protein n=1 Tax=Dreissena polymorpha TaxID=45954 RepID=A0A9D4J5Q1_DREPO|nr:hypothetical protein DPMN_150530 [Dreissena polymorpha]
MLRIQTEMWLAAIFVVAAVLDIQVDGAPLTVSYVCVESVYLDGVTGLYSVAYIYTNGGEGPLAVSVVSQQPPGGQFTIQGLTIYGNGTALAENCVSSYYVTWNVADNTTVYTDTFKVPVHGLPSGCPETTTVAPTATPCECGSDEKSSDDPKSKKKGKGKKSRPRNW